MIAPSSRSTAEKLAALRRLLHRGREQRQVVGELGDGPGLAAGFERRQHLLRARQGGGLWDETLAPAEAATRARDAPVLRTAKD